LIIGAVIAGIALLGGDDSAEASETDGAFLAGMAPHHAMAIDMAEMAQEQAEHPEIKQLADEIVSAQTSEIETIDAIHQRLFDQPVEQGSHGSLGLDSEMMGMSMDMDALDGAQPFDREFVDMMIPHHQGAIRMAQIELADGSDEETKQLAQAIIDAQSMEIEELNQWRQEWYGAPSPAGGVPDEDETMSMDDSMDGMSGMEH